jgi:hypothetical protein
MCRVHSGRRAWFRKGIVSLRGRTPALKQCREQGITAVGGELYQPSFGEARGLVREPDEGGVLGPRRLLGGGG